MPVYVGTSGWQYDSWRGVLYPRRLAQARWLGRYTEVFDTVENNGAFYRLPRRETFESWRSRTPDGFVMAVKASRFLTHIKRLRDAEEPVRRLMEVAGGLGDRLGPVLVQLPPTLQVDVERLDACLRQFPDGVKVAVEPRHESWWTDEVRDVLVKHDAALCWADSKSRPRTPLWRTASWGYLRMHQGLGKPWPRYGDTALRGWADRLTDTWPERADVYVYFNNDPGGAAVRDTARFGAIVRRRGRSVSRVPRLSDLD